VRNVRHLPGVIEWVNPIGEREIKKIIYVIWRNPWMVISRNTFIGSVLECFVESDAIFQGDRAYPELTKAELDQPQNLLLFSSEPYPFHRQKSVLKEFSCATAIVDGESFSWFGIRTLKFLEEHLELI